MTVDEWSARWKRNDDFPDCLACGSLNTKEHHFIQTWCRGNRKWESEPLCLDCHNFSWRSYQDPEFTTPSQHEKERWNERLSAWRTRGSPTGVLEGREEASAWPALPVAPSLIRSAWFPVESISCNCTRNISKKQKK